MIRRLLLLLLLLLAAVPLHAADDLPRFLIERIDVRGLVHASPEIVQSETRLRTGRTYTEAELRDASHRVSRLPFVLDAQFSLEKGSVRDAYVLVITVNESRRFFYVFDQTLLGGPKRDFGGVSDNGAAVGLRWFVGRNGSLHAGLTSNQEYISRARADTSALQAGYTRYNLFGSNAFATINLSVPLLQTARSGHASRSRLLPELVVGIPLSTNQTVTAAFTTSDLRTGLTETERIATGLDEQRFVRRAVRLTWSHNTTDHPFFPTRGTILSVGPVIAWDDDVYAIYGYLSPKPVPVSAHTQTTSFTFEAAHYIPLNPQDTVYFRGYGDLRSTSGDITIYPGYGDVPIEHNAYVAIAAFSHSLWSPERVAVDGDSRLEGSLRYQSRPEYGPGRGGIASVNVNWVRRHAWGSLRLGAGLAW